MIKYSTRTTRKYLFAMLFLIATIISVIIGWNVFIIMLFEGLFFIKIIDGYIDNLKDNNVINSEQYKRFRIENTKFIINKEYRNEWINEHRNNI